MPRHKPFELDLKLTNIFSTEERGGIAGNLAYAVVAQGIGLLSSILTSLVLPKFLGVEDYAYWQLFLLYSSYSGFALLGLNDGIYLRLGGKRYSEVNHGELKAQQCVVAASQLLVAACCLAAVLAAGFEPYRSLVLALCVFFRIAHKPDPVSALCVPMHEPHAYLITRRPILQGTFRRVHDDGSPRGR